MLYKHSKVKINLLLLAMSTFILQWNIRGLNQNYTSGLQPLLANHNPDIVSIQETKLANEKFNVRNYEPYHHINKKSLIAAGGTSLYIRNGLPQKEIKLQTTLQAVAVRAYLFQAYLYLFSIPSTRRKLYPKPTFKYPNSTPQTIYNPRRLQRPQPSLG